MQIVPEVSVEPGVGSVPALPWVATRASGRPLSVAVVLSTTLVVVVTAVAVGVRLLDLTWGGAAPAVAAAGLLLGLPHGAVDHLAPRMRGGSPTLGRLALLANAYLVLAVATWLLLRWLPAAGLAAFLILSVAHFGAGEATFHRLRGVQVGRLVAPSTGLATVLLPLVAHPAAIAPYLALLVPRWDGRLPLVWTSAALLLALALVAAAGLASVRRRQPGVAIELWLLTAMALAAPPVVSVAVYFGAWHAVRHIAVLLVEEEARGSRSAASAVARLARSAVVPTVASLAVLALVWCGVSGGRVDRFISQQVWVLAALTVPHAAVVWWLDRTRGTRQ
ncbi:MAG: Brp/Blh family beta-carotene 15,15'-dioxygenase [Nocardioidaceae bacterium]